MPRLSKEDAEVALDALVIAIGVQNRLDQRKAYMMIKVHDRLKQRLSRADEVDYARTGRRIHNPDE
jgi:hypothetical protein